MPISKKAMFGSIFLVAVVGIVTGGQLGQLKRSKPAGTYSHEGECMNATQFNNISRVVLYMNLDFQSEFSDVPGLTQETIADGFAVLSKDHYHFPSPFLYCLKHSDIKTKVIFEKPTESFGPNDLVLFGKLFHTGKDSPNSRAYLNIQYQIVWPEQKDEYKSSTMYQHHDTDQILNLINDRFDRYMLEQMGYVQPIRREGHFNVQ